MRFYTATTKESAVQESFKTGKTVRPISKETEKAIKDAIASATNSIKNKLLDIGKSIWRGILKGASESRKKNLKESDSADIFEGYKGLGAIKDIVSVKPGVDKQGNTYIDVEIKAPGLSSSEKEKIAKEIASKVKNETKQVDIEKVEPTTERPLPGWTKKPYAVEGFTEVPGIIEARKKPTKPTYEKIGPTWYKKTPEGKDIQVSATEVPSSVRKETETAVAEAGTPAYATKVAPEEAPAVPGKPGGDLIRFTTGPTQYKVYDISGGTLRHVTADEFRQRGLSQDQVQEISGDAVNLERTQGDPTIYAIINGKRIGVTSAQSFSDVGWDWNDVKVGEPEKPKEPTVPTGPGMEVELIRFTTSPTVYDIAQGKLRFVDAEEFKTKNYDREDIRDIDPAKQSIRKDTETGKVYVGVDGKDIWIPDMDTYQATGLSWSVFTEEGKPVIPVPDLIDEYSSGEKLGLIWNRDPDLQKAFTRGGKGRDGTPFEGKTIEEWATTIGWKEYPNLLQEYRPESMVRAAYAYLFDRNPFDPETFDPGATDWVNAVRSGQITGWKELTGLMKSDVGGEWADMTEEERLAIAGKWLTPAEEKIPEFEEFFPEGEIRKGIEEDVNEYYDTQLGYYLEQVETEKGRITEDAERLLGELSEDEERDLTDTQREFRQSLLQANEGYGRAGLGISSLRREEEARRRKILDETKGRIETEYGRLEKEAEREKLRALEDIEYEQKAKEREVERAKKLETEQTLALREQQAIQKYLLGLQQQPSESTTRNIAGYSAFTPYGKFTPVSFTKKKEEGLGGSPVGGFSE